MRFSAFAVNRFYWLSLTPWNKLFAIVQLFAIMQFLANQKLDLTARG